MNTEFNFQFIKHFINENEYFKCFFLLIESLFCLVRLLDNSFA